MVRQMGLAVFATVDARRVEIDVVGEPHDGGRRKSNRKSGAGLVESRQIVAAGC